jgi:hypothetical protein
VSFVLMGLSSWLEGVHRRTCVLPQTYVRPAKTARYGL